MYSINFLQSLYERKILTIAFNCSIDDVHQGMWLPKDKMIEGRLEEMNFFRRMGIYCKVDNSLAKGKPIISTRWVDTNKGTKAEPVYRSRLVAREIKRDDRLDFCRRRHT